MLLIVRIFALLTPILVLSALLQHLRYNCHNPNHTFAYSKFLSAYGTHYTKQVNLGGKRILTTSMSSVDYTSLRRKNVDVENNLTYEVQQGVSASLSVKAGM